MFCHRCSQREGECSLKCCKHFYSCKYFYLLKRNFLYTFSKDILSVSEYFDSFVLFPEESDCLHSPVAGRPHWQVLLCVLDLTLCLLLIQLTLRHLSRSRVDFRHHLSVFWKVCKRGCSALSLFFHFIFIHMILIITYYYYMPS